MANTEKRTDDLIDGRINRSDVLQKREAPTKTRCENSEEDMGQRQRREKNDRKVCELEGRLGKMRMMG